MRRTLGAACRKLVQAKSNAVVKLRSDRDLEHARRVLKASADEAVVTAVKNGARVHPRVIAIKGSRS